MARGIRSEDDDSDSKHEIQDCKAIGATEKAVLVETPDHGKVWIPRSQIHDDSEVYEKGHDGSLVVTAWYARKQGWL